MSAILAQPPTSKKLSTPLIRRMGRGGWRWGRDGKGGGDRVKGGVEVGKEGWRWEGRGGDGGRGGLLGGPWFTGYFLK